MEREKPLPWRAFIGCALTVMSLYAAVLLNLTVLGKTVKPLDPLEPATNLLALAGLVVGIVLIFSGLKEKESETKQ